MLGKINFEQKRATVIGAGVSGLLIAYRLKSLGFDVRVIEKSKRVGGLIKTKRLPFGIAEAAAHSIMATPDVVELFRELNVPLTPVNRDSKARYIWRANQMRKMPLGIFDFVGMFFRLLFVRSTGKTKELTLENLGNSHFGKNATRYLFSPLVTGIYAAQPNEIGVSAAFSRLEVPKGHTFFTSRFFRKGKKARGKMVAPLFGVESLVEALKKEIERNAEKIILDQPIDSLDPYLEEPNLILTTPAPVTAKLIENLSPELAEALLEVKYAPLITATVFIRSEDLPNAPNGVGVLFPQIENRQILGILFNSSSFKGRVGDGWSMHSFTVMMGGTVRPEMLDWDDEKINDTIEKELQICLGAKGRPEHIEIQRWKSAIPIYSPQMPKLWDLANRTWCSKPGRVIFSNYSGEVSIRGLIESIYKIEE